MIMNFIIVLTICFGQNQSDLPSDFSTLQKMSVEELALKTQAHKEVWGLGKIDRWDLTSRCRNYPYERLQAERGRKSEAERQLYDRGNVLALYWDASIRSATGGKASLDDVMRELFLAARDEKRSLSKDSIDRAARRYVKEVVRPDIDRYVELGETIPIRDDLLGPEAEASVIEVGASFDPGFDVDASYAKRIFTGVREEGPAHRAGLRNGQKWIEGGLVFDDPTAIAEFTIEDSGMRKVVKYYPASGEKVRVPQFKLKAPPEKKD